MILKICYTTCIEAEQAIANSAVGHAWPKSDFEEVQKCHTTTKSVNGGKFLLTTLPIHASWLGYLKF